jgi:hypothetical protein
MGMENGEPRGMCRGRIIRTFSDMFWKARVQFGDAHNYDAGDAKEASNHVANHFFRSSPALDLYGSIVRGKASGCRQSNAWEGYVVPFQYLNPALHPELAHKSGTVSHKEA